MAAFHHQNKLLQIQFQLLLYTLFSVFYSDIVQQLSLDYVIEPDLIMRELSKLKPKEVSKQIAEEIAIKLSRNLEKGIDSAT